MGWLVVGHRAARDLHRRQPELQRTAGTLGRRLFEVGTRRSTAHDLVTGEDIRRIVEIIDGNRGEDISRHEDQFRCVIRICRKGRNLGRRVLRRVTVQHLRQRDEPCGFVGTGEAKRFLQRIRPFRSGPNFRCLLGGHRDSRNLRESTTHERGDRIRIAVVRERP